jgi:hypothetical protein
MRRFPRNLGTCRPLVLNSMPRKKSRFQNTRQTSRNSASLRLSSPTSLHACVPIAGQDTALCGPEQISRKQFEVCTLSISCQPFSALFAKKYTRALHIPMHSCLPCFLRFPPIFVQTEKRLGLRCVEEKNRFHHFCAHDNGWKNSSPCMLTFF